MGLFNFLNKKVSCEKCGKEVDKKHITIVDTSHQGRIKSGNRHYFCKECSKYVLIKYISGYKGKAIIIEPSVRYNAYVYYHFDKLKKNTAHSLDKKREKTEIENFMKLLPEEEQKCSHCKNLAQFTFCPIEIFRDADPYNWDIDTSDAVKKEYLCNKCAINRLSNCIFNQDIAFDAIYPNMKGEGFFTPWDI